MTFEFKQGHGEVLLLDEAVQQALDAAYSRHNTQEVHDALVKFINDYANTLTTSYRVQQDDIINGFAELFPNGGWTTEPHPELGEMPEEFASSVVAQARRLAEESTMWKTRLNEETARLRNILEQERSNFRRTVAVCHEAIQGTLAVSADFKEDHPDWSPLAAAIVSLRQSAAAALFLANQRNTRAKKFMAPEAFAEMYHNAVVDFWAETEGAVIQPWNELMAGERERAISFARNISVRHAEAMDGNGQEDDPMILAILENGNALTKALFLVEDLKKDKPYQLLQELDVFLREAFPGQKAAEGVDSALDAPRRAVEILQLVGTVAPQMVKMMWEQIVRPTIHVLQAYGIHVLPPGTIIYGAKTHNNIHRPE